MPNINDYSNPYFIRYLEGPTLSRHVNARRDGMSFGGDNTRCWRQGPTPGYNPVAQSTKPLVINLRNEDMTLPPSAR